MYATILARVNERASMATDSEGKDSKKCCQHCILIIANQCGKRLPSNRRGCSEYKEADSSLGGPSPASV